MAKDLEHEVEKLNDADECYRAYQQDRTGPGFEEKKREILSLASDHISDAKKTEKGAVESTSSNEGTDQVDLLYREYQRLRPTYLSSVYSNILTSARIKLDKKQNRELPAGNLSLLIDVAKEVFSLPAKLLDSITSRSRGLFVWLANGAVAATVLVVTVVLIQGGPDSNVSKFNHLFASETPLLLLNRADEFSKYISTQPLEASYGFSSSAPMESISYKVGQNTVDLSILVLAKDRKNTKEIVNGLASLKGINQIPKDLSSQIDMFIREIQNSELTPAGMSDLSVTFMDTLNDAWAGLGYEYYYNLGQWVRATSLITESAVRGHDQGRLLESLKESTLFTDSPDRPNLSPKVLENLASIGSFSSKSQLSGSDIRQIQKLLQQITVLMG